MTFAQAKNRFSGIISPDGDVGSVIQEVVDRAYEMGRWRGMVEEVEYLPADYVENTDDNEVYLDFDVTKYDGAIGFRRGQHGYDIYGQHKLYEGYGAGTSAFIDMDEVDVSGVTKRRYRAPIGWSTTRDDLKVLIKLRSPSLVDSDTVPIKSVGALKRGILAVSLEDVDEFQKADQHWAAFNTFMEAAQRQFSGNQKFNIHIDSAMRRRPTGFM